MTPKERKAARRAADALSRKGEGSVRVTGQIKLDSNLEADRPKGSQEYGSHTHFEVRLHERAGVPLEETPKIASAIHQFLLSVAPEVLVARKQGGTARLALPVQGKGALIIWIANGNAILRTFFPSDSEEARSEGPYWWVPEYEQTVARILE